jgi:GntR family transcriptional regulator, transcriptional repressor for pyruvate dehydrogenase complex
MGSPKVDQAINGVKSLILTGRLRSGDRLPNEEDLSAMLDVSRNSLREAVRAMQTMKILEARQGDGTYVADLDPANMMEILSFAVDVSDAQSVAWFLELRRTLEVSSVQETAARRTEAQVGELTKIHQDLLVEGKPEEVLRLDGEFHLKIAEIAGNPILHALVKVVTAPTLRARVARQRLSDRDHSGMREQHQEILDAVVARDVERARMAMWHHINQVLLWVRQHPDRLSNG